MKSPIAVILFNRPDQAEQLRERLRPEELRELYVISDGAREGRPGEVELVEKCRRIFSDWPGKVHFDYASKNLGCKARVSSGLDWVFEHTDRAIILEDDCLPHPYFFEFCDELLETYYENETVMSVCGTKTFPENLFTGDYAFSKYSNCWGWATWKRAWAAFDDRFTARTSFNMFTNLKKILGSYRAAFYWSYIIHCVLTGKINSWAYCWPATCFFKNGLHVYPRENLVVNNGFGGDSTHTKYCLNYAPENFGNPISFPLSRVENIRPSPELDQWIEDTIFSKSITNRIKWLFSRVNLS